ncbi:unnamed protein product [Lupinus luteus]|uniref:DNA-3-methyladenine glycosylase I n=1 Tax=Lupinus luteus TaxID=3873 RepID=A0AAV1W394_LUPLU
MYSSKAKVTVGIEATATAPIARINGRPVLQPNCNHVPNLERRNSIKKVSLSPTPLPSKTTSLTPLVSPKSKSPRPAPINRGNESSSLNPSSEKILIPRNSTKTSTLERKKSKSFKDDPIYIAYHDEEWGVPVHDDKMLFELLVLIGVQVGSDWTSILKKRQGFRTAFSEFDAAIVANLNYKQMMSISSEHGIDISIVRGVVDNANRILEIKKDFGSFGKYIWSFVNHKPMSTQYKFGHKIPVKTSKSESISKDMVRRGFRFVGPTMLHSFMQASGLTNDHLITCHRHMQCTLLAY